MIIGFVANVYNPVNFDIDLGTMTDFHIRQLLSRHKLVTTQYTYTDDNPIALNPSIRTGMTFRCRLAGILIKKNELPALDYSASLRKLTYHVNKLNGWVYVNIIGIDRYQRVLVELYDVITGESIVNQLLAYSSVYMNYH
jgi:hypothetical protein